MPISTKRIVVVVVIAKIDGCVFPGDQQTIHTCIRCMWIKHESRWNIPDANYDECVHRCSYPPSLLPAVVYQSSTLSVDIMCLLWLFASFSYPFCTRSVSTLSHVAIHPPYR